MSSDHRPGNMTLPEVAFIAGTRAALGAGIALLLADRLSSDRRAAIGWTLTAIGAMSTIPLALTVWGRARAGDRLPADMEGANGLGRRKAFVW